MRAALIPFVIFAAGCVGAIDSPPAGPSGDRPSRPGIDPDDPQPPDVDGPPSVAPASAARLSPHELQSSLVDLFGAEALEGLPLEASIEGALRTPISAVDAVAAFTLADMVSGRVYASPAVRVCGPEEPSCFETIARTLGRRVFRRPLRPEEASRYAMAAAASPSFDEGVRVMVAAMLASPKFFYRLEWGDPVREERGVRPLTDHEMASRLSYALWQSTPDEALLAAADAGLLSTAEQVRAEARRLLDAPRARQTVVRFHRWWLGLNGVESIFRDAGEYPAFDDAMPAAWGEESDAFVEQVVFDGAGTLVELFTASHTLADPAVAAVYGAAPPDGSGRVELPPGERAGLLTQAGVLSMYAPDERVAPIHRGAFVYRHVLCAPLADPPPGIPPLAPRDPSASLRQQITAATSGHPCVGCHGQFNAFGFALGAYDAIGARQPLDGNGQPVDARVTLAGPDDLAGVEVDGAAALGQALAGSAALRDCYVDRWFRYLTGREIEPAEGDEPSRLWVQYDFEVAERDVRALLVAMVGSDAFRHLRVPVD